ncbi:MAG: class I SAM-dependent methyltransferase [Calditrichaeota bacterium]|nr:class I SAM-dependent methyltransferase [Calditrichota bacterium]
MSDYYADKLSAERLKRCYEIAPPSVQQYLKAEIEFVLEKIKPGDTVLELGCGYGRVLVPLARKARRVVGIDTSLASLQLAQDELWGISNCYLAAMDAAQLGFRDKVFDVVVCIQNGISAFHVDQKDLIRESVRVAKSGGIVLFSSYSEKFWNARLEWFERQSEAGLLGEIDYDKTRDGIIVCKDGFTATTVRPDEFLSLTSDLNAKTRLIEVDESSLFCEMIPRRSGDPPRQCM